MGYKIETSWHFKLYISGYKYAKFENLKSAHYWSSSYYISISQVFVNKISKNMDEIDDQEDIASDEEVNNVDAEPIVTDFKSKADLFHKFFDRYVSKF